MKLALTPGFLTDFHHIASLGATGMEKSEHSVVQGAEDRLHPVFRTLREKYWYKHFNSLHCVFNCASYVRFQKSFVKVYDIMLS